MKFKKGDRLRRIEKNHDVIPIKIGDIITFDKWLYDGFNKAYFYSEEYPTISCGVNYFELVSSQEEVLPEKWYILGSSELREYIKNTSPASLRRICGDQSDCEYYIDQDGLWNCNSIGNNKNRIRITFEQFKQLINKNENNNKQINEVQGITPTNSGAIGSKPVRSNCRNSKITTGARLSSNKISSKPISSRIKQSTTKGSIFKSVYS